VQEYDWAAGQKLEKKSMWMLVRLKVREQEE
jgi:hypothetical protein